METTRCSWLAAALLAALFSCEDSGTGPEEPAAPREEAFVMADYTALTTGNWWRYEQVAVDTAEYGSQLEEFVGTPVMFDSVVCHPYVHRTTAQAYPDTSFVNAANPLLLEGFAWRGLRFVYRPAYRQAADTMRVGDTVRFAYDVALAGGDTALTDTSFVTIVACGIDSSPVHTEHFGTCLKLRVEDGSEVEERWLVKSVGTVASMRWEGDSLILTERLAAATIAGISLVYR